MHTGFGYVVMLCSMVKDVTQTLSGSSCSSPASNFLRSDVEALDSRVVLAPTGHLGLPNITIRFSLVQLSQTSRDKEITAISV